jgi:hypothetical protein
MLSPFGIRSTTITTVEADAGISGSVVAFRRVTVPWNTMLDSAIRRWTFGDVVPRPWRAIANGIIAT